MTHDENSDANLKPPSDEMQSGPTGGMDVASEVMLLAARPDSDDAEILRQLQTLGSRFSVDEVFAVLVRFDTPDVLG